MSYSLDGLRSTCKEHIASAHCNAKAGNKALALRDLEFAAANTHKLLGAHTELTESILTVLKSLKL